ncbi:MAG: PilW family protein [Pseudomonadota bacterium]
MKRFLPMHRAQRGVTLVELMVTIALNLVLVLAATLLYLNGRNAQKAVDERGAVFEAGNLALDMLGREIGNAAFYPAVSAEPVNTSRAPGTNVLWSHDLATTQSMSGVPTPYQHGIFGCDGRRFDASAGACAAHDSTSGPAGSDALVVTYFTNDAFSMDRGQRADCTYADVGGSGYNAGRERAAGSAVTTTGALGVAPDAPLLVVNRYQLVKRRIQVDGAAVDTFSLACSGNGTADNNTGYQELIRGVEQFELRYGVMDDTTLRPRRYLTAAQVAGLGDANIDGVVYQPWRRVVSVRVCLLVRSTSGSALRTGVNGQASATTDCNGSSYTPPGGAQVRRFEQVFSVKNRQTQSI